MKMKRTYGSSPLFDALVSVAIWRWLFAGLLSVLGYLSFKPNPAIQEVGWMPKSAAEWFDLYSWPGRRGWERLPGVGLGGV
jgi:hypothetical protein